MPPAGYPAFLQYLQSGRVRDHQDHVGWIQLRLLEASVVVLLRKSLLTRPGHESGVRDRRGGPAVLVLWLVRSWRGIVVKKTRMANLTGEAQESTNFYGKRSLLLAVCATK